MIKSNSILIASTDPYVRISFIGAPHGIYLLEIYSDDLIISKYIIKE